MKHDCQDHLQWVEQEEFDGENDVYLNSFWAVSYTHLRAHET